MPATYNNLEICGLKFDANWRHRFVVFRKKLKMVHNYKSSLAQ